MMIAQSKAQLSSDLTAIRGLTQAEVLARRARGLGNTLPLRTSRTYTQILRESVFNFINNILFVLGTALVVLGRYLDAAVSLAVVLSNTAVSVVQEVRAKRILDRIALLTRPRVTVLRDGLEQLIDPAEIVLGDVLVARPGDQIVVDGRLVGSGRIDVDESLLSGESDLVAKRAGDAVYSGSFCVTGTALYEATRVGADSLANQLTAGAQAFRRVLTPLQRQLYLAVRVILAIAIFIEILLALQALVHGIPVVQSVEMSMVIVGLVPNGLFLAVAVAYALGAVRIAKQGVLVQQANAVESLSHVDVLCTDKTGTLTANRLRLQALHPLGISESQLRRLLGDYVTNASDGNRTSQAIAQACGGQARRVCDEVPFASQRKWSALAFDDPALHGVYSLGAPEVLRPKLSPGAGWEAVADQWSGRGLRVLMFAGRPEVTPLHNNGEQPQLPDGLQVMGLIGLSDELRPHALETLDGFTRAGVQLKIISGDHPQTVAALVKQAGLKLKGPVLSGAELAELSEVQLATAAEEASVFGRVTPHQKEQLVQALRGRGHYVAMIGDGVNDVLSLKRANLGIAMQSGSPATRSVADIVLLDDSFAALPHALGEGQRILNGMQDILKLFLIRVLYVALLIVSLAVVGGFPYTPRQSAILALFTVGIPTLALAAWARPGVVPRRGGLIRSLLGFVLPAVITLVPTALGVYLAYFVPAYLTFRHAYPFGGWVAGMEAALPLAQSALTTVTVFCGLLLIPFAEPPVPALAGGDTVSGDWRPTFLTVALLAVFGVVLCVPGLRNLFELAPLRGLDYGVLVGVAVGWAVVLRWVWRTNLVGRFLNAEF